MKIILSGITSTGRLTIGNYIGAIKNFVALQKENNLFIFVADLHGLTNDISPEKLSINRKDIMALYLACGLDPKKSTLFYQSDVHAHGMMSWIMENRTTIGELSRMTQFKDKSTKKQSNGTEKISTGLLTYPALMAGDILLYNADLVPTGRDQKQHIELTRNIAERFNNEFGKTFKIPEPFEPKVGAKIMSLQDPSKKMSKSDLSEKASIFLLDEPEIARKKIMKAVTDSEGKIYLSDDKPGIKNLLTIYSALKEIDIKEAEKEFKDENYGTFKKAVADEVVIFLRNIQKRYKKALSIIDDVAKEGALKANKVANETLEKVKSKIGLK